jgi:hypothetical protein
MVLRGLVCFYQPGADADLVIYDSAGTQLRSVSIDGNTVRSNATRMYQGVFASDLTVTGGSTYYLVLKPTTATSVSITTMGYNAAGHLEASWLGKDAYSATRTDAGAWTTNTAEQHPIGVIVSEIGSTGGGGGGGVIIHPGMTGGMRG